MKHYQVYATPDELKRADEYVSVFTKIFGIEDGYPLVLATIHTGSSLMMDLYPEQAQLIFDETNKFFATLKEVVKINTPTKIESDNGENSCKSE